MALPWVRDGTENEEISEGGHLAQIQDPQIGDLLGLSCIRSRAPVWELSSCGREALFNRTACQTRLNLLLRLAY